MKRQDIELCFAEANKGRVCRFRGRCALDQRWPTGSGYNQILLGRRTRDARTKLHRGRDPEIFIQIDTDFAMTT